MPDWSRELHKAFSLATAPLRARLDFIIPGEAKCGTSSLYKYLRRHPRFVAADVKEPNNFLHYPTSLLRSRQHFPFAWKKRAGYVAGEASAEYFSKRSVPGNLQKVAPHLKFIVMMRHPVTRAFSDFQMLRKLETESFETLARRAVKWLADASLTPLTSAVAQNVLNPVRYIERGLYLQHLQPWLAAFPREQFLFLKSEDLFADPQRICNQAWEFLGLSPHQLDQFPIAKQGSYDADLQPETAALLADFYGPHNRALYDFLGRDLGWEKECEERLQTLSRRATEASPGHAAAAGERVQP